MSDSDFDKRQYTPAVPLWFYSLPSDMMPAALRSAFYNREPWAKWLVNSQKFYQDVLIGRNTSAESMSNTNVAEQEKKSSNSVSVANFIADVALINREMDKELAIGAFKEEEKKSASTNQNASTAVSAVSVPVATDVPNREVQNLPLVSAVSLLTPVVVSAVSTPVVVDDKKRKSHDWQCPVCLDVLYAPGMVPCLMSGCDHMICKKCGDSVSHTSSTCPVCRASFSRISVLRDLVDTDDPVAMARMIGQAHKVLTEAEANKRIDNLDLSGDPNLRLRVQFVMAEALRKMKTLGTRTSAHIAWNYVPYFDENNISLLVTTARAVMNIKSPSRHKLQVALLQKAREVEVVLNMVFLPHFSFEAVAQSNYRGTAQEYMRLKITQHFE